MWTLVRKDLILHGRVMTLNYFMYLAMCLLFMTMASDVPPRLVALWAGIVGGLFPVSLVSRDDKFRLPALTCSLPTTRDAVVSARFAAAWGLAGLATLGLLGSCWLAVRTGLVAQTSGWQSAPLVAFVTVGVVLAALLPFTTRFGFAGLVGFLVFTQVLGVVAFLVAVFLGGHGTFRVWIGGTVEALRFLGNSLGSAGLVLLVVAANGVSLFLCRRIYRAREL